MSLFSLLSCLFSEITSYEENDSEVFYKDLNIDALQLKDHFVDNVLFTVDVKEVVGNEYLFWLGLYSKFNNKVWIDRVVVRSGSYLNEKIIRESISLKNKAKNTRLFKNSVKLFQIKADTLNQLIIENERIVLEVFYQRPLSTGEITGSIRFIIKQHIKKYPVFST